MQSVDHRVSGTEQSSKEVSKKEIKDFMTESKEANRTHDIKKLNNVTRKSYWKKESYCSTTLKSEDGKKEKQLEH